MELREEGIIIPTWFVRGRNALLARAEFSELFVEYYLHLSEAGIRPGTQEDEMLKELIAMIGLHCASRPWNETTAWTVNFQNPPLNLFVSGDNRFGALVGRSFTEAVHERSRGIFYADTLREGMPLRRSVVEFDQESVLESVEHFYRQSEQRPARLFRCGSEDYALVVAQPGCDHEWLESLTADCVMVLGEREELGLLEERRYQWRCGCDEQKILGILAPVFRAEGEGLFEGEPTVRMQCPRCGARFVVTREALEAYLMNSAERTGG